MKNILPLLALVLCSCTGYMHEARSASGNYVRDVIVKVGGTASMRGSDGSSIVTDDQQSLRDVVSGITTASATSAYKAGALAKEATTRHAATQTTIQAKNAADAANEAARIQSAAVPLESGSSLAVPASGAIITAP